MENPPHRSRWLTGVLVGLLAGAVTVGAGAQPNPEAETFVYRWRLTSLLGKVAGLFFPSRGDGVLEFTTKGSGNLVSQLEITSTKSAKGEFWIYGAEVDPRQKKIVRAWSSYKYRDKNKSKEEPVGESGVIDIASGIQAIRKAPPAAPQRLRIWSDGKIYPVEIIPKGTTSRRLGKKAIPTRHFVVRGLEVPGERFWKGSLELWLDETPRAAPVAILIKRSGLGVLLELKEAS